MEKAKKPFYKRWWFIVFIIGIALSVIFSPSEEERAEMEAAEAAEVKAQDEAAAKKKAEAEAKKAEEKKAKEAEAAKEKAEIDAIIVLFQEAGAEMVASSNGIIADVNIAYNTNHFNVEVFVDEATWAVSNESEKMSFATTVGTSIENALSPHSTYVDIVSAANKDVVASQKLFGGWKIKR
jgi:hypothetical protein